jgi:hypothetical protein
LGRVGSSGAYRGPTVAEAGSAVAMPNIYLQPDKPQLKKKKQVGLLENKRKIQHKLNSFLRKLLCIITDTKQK